MSDSTLVGKAALITGAGDGIGYAMTKLFAARGAQVAAVSRRSQSVEKWQKVQNVIPIQADITRHEDIDRMFSHAESCFGKLDIVCNVAGINDLCYPLHETSDERWNQVMDLDLKAPFWICRKVIPGMVARGGGTILNIGSYAALRGNHGPSYSAAKHALVGLTLSIAVYYARQGIRCNVIHPGAVRTQIAAHSGGEYHPEGLAMFMDIAGKLPVSWVCDAEEIARVAAFLCCDDSRHVNGAIISVDGGMSAC